MNNVDKIINRGFDVVNLPGYVFNKKFRSFLFFDDDFCSSEELVKEIQSLLNMIFEKKTECHIFSQLNGGYICSLEMCADWVKEINAIRTKMHDDGDYYGLIIIDSEEQWAIFQKSPVDDGVIAIDVSQSTLNDYTSKCDFFFNCEDVKKWIGDEIRKDPEYIKKSSYLYLSALTKNYCAAVV